jgi:hypothetical protein
LIDDVFIYHFHRNPEELQPPDVPRRLNEQQHWRHVAFVAGLIMNAFLVYGVGRSKTLSTSFTIASLTSPAVFVRALAVANRT